MQPLQNLLQNKQLRTIFIAAAALCVLVFVALTYASHIETEKQTPGQAAPAPEPEAPPAPPNADNSQLILDLFSPSDESLASQNYEAIISRQIEQSLTISYVLTKCLIISQDDYSDTYRALLIYAELTGLAPDTATADAKLREIAQAANASYSLIYSRTSCSDPHLPGLAAQLSDWVTAMFSRKK